LISSRIDSTLLAILFHPPLRDENSIFVCTTLDAD
jgi:hypothetical protein